MLEISIRKRLGEFELDIQLVASDDQIVVLFGPSGAGKSMTLASVAGFMVPDSGRIAAGKQVLFDSDKRINLAPQLRHIGLVRQQLALFPHLTVGQNVDYGLFRAPARTRRDRVLSLLQLMRLDGLADRYPAQLSGGQQQRVALARALAPTPELLLLDEPFSALDAPTRMQLRDELLSLQRTLKIPIVFVTHDLGEAYFLADRLAVIDAGRILQLDTPGEILQHPDSLQVARAIGVKNILAGTLETGDDRGCSVRVGQVVLDAPTCSGPNGSPVHICLRSERIMLVHPERGSDVKHENMLFGEIIREMSDGANATLYFRGNTRLVTDGSQDYDLQIELPVYIYERLNLAHRRKWTVSLKKNAVHLIR
ncbi:MAG TPA: ABC transporter ATP-binding protein [Anaerolineae bacterium]